MYAEEVTNRWKSSKGAEWRRPASSFRASNYAWKKFVSLDGENSTYTTVLLICMNLGLLVWVFERRLLEGRTNALIVDHVEGTVFIRHLYKTSIVIVCAAINGLLAFLLLALNLRDLESRPTRVWRRWLLLSIFGIFGANGFAILVITSAQHSYKWRRDTQETYERPVTHYMILCIFAIFIYILDILYIRTIYLPFVRRKQQGWEYIRCNLQDIIQLGRRERGETSLSEEIGYWMTTAVSCVVGWMNSLIFHCLNFWERIFIRLGDSYADQRSCSGIKELSRWISEASLAPIRFLRWSPFIQLPLYLVHSLEYVKKGIDGMLRPVYDILDRARIHGMQHDAARHHRVLRGILIVMDRFIGIFTRFKPEVQRAAVEFWDSIKEDENYSHSSWLKAAVVTAVILLIYFGMCMAFEFQGYLDDVYLKHRNCILNNPGISNLFLRFIGFHPHEGTLNATRSNSCATSLRAFETNPANITSEDFSIEGLTYEESGEGLLTDYSRRLGDRISENREEDHVYRCEERQRSKDVCILLAAVNMGEDRSSESYKPCDAFFDSFSGQVVYLFDVYMRHLNWTIWVGFIVGLLFGCWTLLSVMGQYKRLSLAIRSGLLTDFDLEKDYRSPHRRPSTLDRMDSIFPTHSFAACISRYPMSTSIFFSGMLISTAVLQLVVFGGMVASVFSLFASLTDGGVRRILAPIFWILLAFLITWLVNGPIATYVLGEGLLVSRFQVIHELLFFLFLLIFSSIHLVVGIFLAFFRMLYVILNSLVMINRLDKNLLTYHKGFDLGHRSFMALVLLQHVFHVNKSGSTELKTHWNEVLAKLEDVEKDEAMAAVKRSMSLPRQVSEPARLEEGVSHFIDEDETGGANARRQRDSNTDALCRCGHSTGCIIVHY